MKTMVTLMVLLMLGSAPALAGEPARGPAGWTAETKKVKVVTPDKPDGMEKEITYHKNTIGMEFVRIEPGEFVMGDPDSKTGAGPQHKVRITKPFLMGATEVSQAQWKTVMGTTLEQQRDKEDTSLWVHNRGEGPEYPMYFVSWEEAVEFCKRLSAKEGKTYRLPTEAEWEYACRAGTITRFYSGDAIGSDLAMFHDASSGAGTGVKAPVAPMSKRMEQFKALLNSPWHMMPVGCYPANPWGLYDMAGNAWEWVADFWSETYYQESPANDPRGPNEAQAAVDEGTGKKLRVIRGGNYSRPAKDCASAARWYQTSDARSTARGGGFRVCVEDAK